MPIHWGIDGQPDGWASRLVGAGMGPVIHFGVIALVQVLRHADPRQDNIAQSAPALDAMKTNREPVNTSLSGLKKTGSVKKRFWTNEARRVGAMKSSRGMKQNVHRVLFIPGRGGPNGERRPGTQLSRKLS